MDAAFGRLSRSSSRRRSSSSELTRGRLGTHDGQRGSLRHEPVGLVLGLGELGREPLGASPQLSLALRISPALRMRSIRSAASRVCSRRSAPRGRFKRRAHAGARRRIRLLPRRRDGRRRAAPRRGAPGALLTLTDDGAAARWSPELLRRGARSRRRARESAPPSLTGAPGVSRALPHLRDRLAEVREAGARSPEGFPRPGLASGQRRETRAQARSPSRTRTSSAARRSPRGEPGIVPRDQRHAQIALLRWSVLYCCASFAWRSAKRASAHLVHDVRTRTSSWRAASSLPWVLCAGCFVTRESRAASSMNTGARRLAVSNVVELSWSITEVRAWLRRCRREVRESRSASPSRADSATNGVLSVPWTEVAVSRRLYRRRERVLLNKTCPAP